jgi:hypothetical protein
MQPNERAPPASTASSCTKHTPTPWLRSSEQTRDDGYGTTREGHVRLPLKCCAHGASAPAGRSAACSARSHRRRQPIDDAAWFSAELAHAGIDFVSVSKGGQFETQSSRASAKLCIRTRSYSEGMPTMRLVPSGPFGRNHRSRAIRDAVRAAGYDTPIVGSGSINVRPGGVGVAARRLRFRRGARQSLADRIGGGRWSKVAARSAALHLHELLRSARSTALAGDVSALDRDFEKTDRSGTSHARKTAAPIVGTAN